MTNLQCPMFFQCAGSSLSTTRVSVDSLDLIRSILSPAEAKMVGRLFQPEGQLAKHGHPLPRKYGFIYAG